MLRTIKQFTVVPLVLAVFLMFGTVPSQAACPEGSSQVIIFHAGSLNNAFTAVELAFKTENPDICVDDQRFGSLDMLRQATAGGLAADIIAPADYLDIDLFLKKDGYADYDILFAKSKMVLAYLESDIVTAKGYTIAASPTFNPPDTVPDAVADWYNILLKSDVTIGGSHLYLDPSAYRGPMIFRLAQTYYGQSNLYNNLLKHYVVTPQTGAPAGTFALGKTHNFQFTYERNAEATAKTNPDYRYVNLPDEINLGDSEKNLYYRQAVVVVPDLFGTGLVSLPASRVIFGVTVLKNAPNKDNAIKFLEFLLGQEGQEILQTYGPDPIPPVVSHKDYQKLPKSLRSLVQADDSYVFPGGGQDVWKCHKEQSGGK